MKKRIIISVYIGLLTAISLVTFGQKGFKVGIAMGSVLPVGEFKSDNNTSLNSGYANNGFCLNIDGDYFLHNRFAISARFHFGMADINEIGYLSRIENNLGSFFSPTKDNVYSNFSNWQWSAPMLGFKYNLPIIINKLYVDAGLFSGLSISKIPDQNAHIEDKENLQTIFTENINGQSLAVPIMADLGIRLILNDAMQIKCSGGYFLSKTEFTHTSYIVKYQATDVEKVLANYNFAVPIKTLNFTIGLIYTL